MIGFQHFFKKTTSTEGSQHKFEIPNCIFCNKQLDNNFVSKTSVRFLIYKTFYRPPD